MLYDSMEDVENDIKERKEEILSPVNKILDVISNLFKKID